MVAITIPADYAYLSDAYNLVESQAKELGLNESDVYGVKLATDEAVTNIILHGYKEHADTNTATANDSGLIRIEVTQDGKSLTIILTDSGPQYDPTSTKEPDLSIPLSQRKPGGMGVFLMREKMDAINYQQTQAGQNQLTMIKRKK